MSKLRDEVLAHYDRMIAWADAHIPHPRPATWMPLQPHNEMQDDIGEGITADDCPLCARFNVREHKNCQDCPVYKKTGKTFCRQSPYMDIHAASQTLSRIRFRDALFAERTFLASLEYPDTEENDGQINRI